MSRHGRLHMDDRDVAAVEVADTARERTRGLLGRDGLDGAMLLQPASSVHTFRMAFPIDVAYLGRDGTVRATVTMAPNRLGLPRWGAHAVLEAEAGSFGAWGLRVGVVVDVVDQVP